MANRVLLDEVIRITGTISQEGAIIFSNKLIWPDIPKSHRSALDGANVAGKTLMAKVALHGITGR